MRMGVVLVFGVLACSGERGTPAPGAGSPAPSVTVAPPDAPTSASAGAPDPRAAASVPSVAIDPALSAALAMPTRDCVDWQVGLTWLEGCPAARRVSELANARKADEALAAACAATLASTHSVDRWLAALCLVKLDAAVVEPHLTAALDAFDVETDLGLRRALASAVGAGEARRAGVEARVIASVRALAVGNENDDLTASSLAFSLYAHSDPIASRDAGDFALELVRDPDVGGSTRFVAWSGVNHMLDRPADVCPVLAELAVAGDWSKPVDVMARFAGFRVPCTRWIDRVVATIADSMHVGALDVAHYFAAEVFIQNQPLTPAQIARLADAARDLPRTAPPHLRRHARDLLRRLRRHRPPT